MSFLQWLNPIDGIIKTVGSIIDDLHLSGEEKAEAQRKLLELQQNYEIERQKIENSFQEELTKRHEADMSSDSPLAKNIRPYTLMFLLGVTTFLAITDGNVSFDWATINPETQKEVVKNYSFTIKEVWVDLYTVMASSAVIFYFGGRSWEKKARIERKEQ